MNGNHQESLAHDLQKLIQNNDTSKIKTVPFGGSSLKDLWKSKKEFNYNLKIYSSKGGIIKTTPFGNTILKELLNSNSEKRKFRSKLKYRYIKHKFSSTDYIGHKYGPHS